MIKTKLRVNQSIAQRETSFLLVQREMCKGEGVGVWGITLDYKVLWVCSFQL
jgi:hypothetical protein